MKTFYKRLVRNWGGCAFILWAFSVSAFGADWQAGRNSCPSADFGAFFLAFSASSELQESFVAPDIDFLQLARSENGFDPESKRVYANELRYPIVMNATGFDETLEFSVDGNEATVVDKRSGLSHIKVFKFHHDKCWVLNGFEDWSVKDADLKLGERPDMTEGQETCLKKGVVFANLGAPEKYPLTQEFYEAAEENYVCAAASGDAEANYAAASLSASQMAPYLGFTRTEGFYIAAAKGMPKIWLTLAEFYCDGGDSSAPDGPCVHPVEAKKAVLSAVNAGVLDALITLGQAYEVGRFEAVDTHKARACYQAAANRGSEKAKAALGKLPATDSEKAAAESCN